MFLGTDDPDRIVSLLDQYPWFENLYRDLYTACCNTEKVMDMFSEELRILDRNTAQYMIDEMEAERMLCDRMGMDSDLARKAVQKFWEKK